MKMLKRFWAWLTGARERRWRELDEKVQRARCRLCESPYEYMRACGELWHFEHES